MNPSLSFGAAVAACVDYAQLGARPRTTSPSVAIRRSGKHLVLKVKTLNIHQLGVNRTKNCLRDKSEG